MDGGRTHRGPQRDPPPVLKTGEPTGTQPLPTAKDTPGRMNLQGNNVKKCLSVNNRKRNTINPTLCELKFTVGVHSRTKWNAKNVVIKDHVRMLRFLYGRPPMSSTRTNFNLIPPARIQHFGCTPIDYAYGKSAAAVQQCNQASGRSFSECGNKSFDLPSIYSENHLL